MAINNKPIFTGTPQINWCINAMTGSTTTSSSGSINNIASVDTLSGSNGAVGNVVVFIAFTADATNGGYVQKIRFKNIGTTTTTVARIWINNGGAISTATNNVLYDEITLTTQTVSQTSATNIYELPLNFALPAGYKILVTLGTSSTAGAGWQITTIGGSYTALP